MRRTGNEQAVVNRTWSIYEKPSAADIGCGGSRASSEFILEKGSKRAAAFGVDDFFVGAAPCRAGILGWWKWRLDKHDALEVQAQ